MRIPAKLIRVQNGEFAKEREKKITSASGDKNRKEVGQKKPAL